MLFNLSIFSFLPHSIQTLKQLSLGYYSHTLGSKSEKGSQIPMILSSEQFLDLVIQKRTCSVENGVLKNFTNFTGKHLCWSLFLMKL